MFFESNVFIFAPKIELSAIEIRKVNNAMHPNKENSARLRLDSKLLKIIGALIFNSHLGVFPFLNYKKVF